MRSAEIIDRHSFRQVARIPDLQAEQLIQVFALNSL
jgi:hypothetical protein